MLLIKLKYHMASILAANKVRCCRQALPGSSHREKGVKV